jgi:hypothetical protein
MLTDLIFAEDLFPALQKDISIFTRQRTWRKEARYLLSFLIRTVVLYRGL